LSPTLIRSKNIVLSKEIQRILEAIGEMPVQEQAVLATVVDLKGSGYRLPGARMLIAENGAAYGTVSGGCLEADVLSRAKNVLNNRKADVFVYDTTAEENSVFSLNMGCRGVIRILLEPVTRNSRMIETFRSVWNDRRRETIATFIGGDQNERLAIGSRICVGPDNSISDPDGVVKLFTGIDDDLFTFHESTAPFDTMRYVNDAGEGEFAFETLSPPVLMMILGAGADAVPLATTGHDLGWQIHVVDHRPAFLTKERFPNAEELRLIDRESVNLCGADRMTAIVSVNHNYERDKESIAAALGTEAFYIGALGPKMRTEQILEELGKLGKSFTPDVLARLHYPAGLDIGATAPETIAISIIAEIQSTLADRPGGPLRARNASIYDRK
jgi:xanthine dehydrogenase accessory factor